MKKIFGIVLTVIAMVSMVSTASASDFYVTGNVANTHINNESGSVNGGGVGVGYDVTSWLAAEVTYDYIGKEDGVTAQSAAVWAVVDPTVATIASMPLKVTGRVGYARNKFACCGGAIYDTGLAYGAGLALGVTDNLDVTVGYTRREVTVGVSDFDLDTVNLGAKYSF